ncbi:hypothetical protein ACNKHT_25845 [Shigella flexneri]
MTTQLEQAAGSWRRQRFAAVGIDVEEALANLIVYPFECTAGRAMMFRF